MNLRCVSQVYTQDGESLLVGRTSLLAELDAIVLEQRKEKGDEEAHLVFEAMVAVCRSILSFSCSSEGNVDAIVLTNQDAHSEMMVEWIAIEFASSSNTSMSRKGS